MKTAPPAIPADRVTREVIAKKYGVTPQTVSNWAKAGRIPFIKIAGSIRFDLAAVIEAVEGKKP